MKRDWRNFFRAEDFLIEWETPDGFRFEANSPTGRRIAEAIAGSASALIREELEKSEKMHGHLHNWGGEGEIICDSVQCGIRDTHVATIIDKRELK